MNLEDVRKIRVRRKKRMRVGRGQGSGWGTTSGRGHKGAGQRSGNRIRLRFEGGQMPLYRRLPKMGFTNARFKLRYYVVNVGELERTFDADTPINLATIQQAGLAPKRAEYLKILGTGELSKAFVIEAHAISDGAKKKVEEAGGSITLLPARTEYRERGVKKSGAAATPTKNEDEATS